MFFTGLHSLLTVVAQRRVLLATSRVESVKARLHVMGGAIASGWSMGGPNVPRSVSCSLPAARNQCAGTPHIRSLRCVVKSYPLVMMVAR
jgi:hypothetical protein